MTTNASTEGSHDYRFLGTGHAVQFYESDDFLHDVVAEFAASGLRNGQSVVLIATDAHCQGFAGRLQVRGVDVAGALAKGELVLLDAAETLSRFMVDGAPDPVKFRTVMGGLIEQTARGNTPVRAYGEMVDLLWRDGHPGAAIRLEELWNDLATAYSFGLLCAYPMGNFYKESHTIGFEEVCRMHTHVIPAETIASLTDREALGREITLLQQRAQALEAEIEHRQELEKALRDALAARRKAERELKDFVDNATVAMHWVAADGTILWANDAEMQLLGYSRDEYIGRNIVDFHADRPVIEDILRRLAANESIHDYEARLRAKDGSIRHVAISSNVWFEDGTFVHSRCFTRDVTDRKRLEEATRRANEDNAFLLDATTALNRSLAYEARLREVVELAVPRLADWCAIDVIGDDQRRERKGATGVLDGDLSNLSERIEEVAQSGHPSLSDRVFIVPMKTGDTVVGVLALAYTESGRQYSPADVNLAAEFARRASIAIENARLYHLAQEANHIKDQFLATLSHELRTPLTAILGWARMLTMGGLEPELVRTACSTIERSARTQAALVDDLLDLSRVVTGKLTLRREPVDLGHVIDGALETVHLAAESKEIPIVVRPFTGRAIVAGDPTRLQQIVWNLLSNAVKFSDKGGTVHLAVERHDDAVRVTVRDEGRGIAPEFLPHVFEPFRQADGATTREHGGLGLGLAIVKYLTELHGGSVRVMSEGPGLGATFTVTLPLALSRSVVPETADTRDSVDLSGVTVLVVDDDQDTRDLIAAILRRSGAEVLPAASVHEATAVLAKASPHIVVTDIAMPEKDGFAFLTELRSADERLRRLPVLALTASAGDEAESRAAAAGFDAYVKKPVDPLHIARAVFDLRP